MKIDAALAAPALVEIPAVATAIEAAGYDGALTFEGPHDPFFPLLLAAEHTERIDLMTAVAIAFARNPMTLAQVAYDLQLASRGRFVLGLGSQIRPHIEQRFSMPWSQPAARMRELVLAVRAIWACWHEGVPLDFHGEFYRHTLMTPMFDPGPNPFGLPRVFLAGVGPRMVEVAGEVGDGFLVHPFTTERYLREAILPGLAAGAARSGRALAEVEIGFPVLVATGATEADRVAAEDLVRAQLGFYGSTPAYRPVLDLHGWGDLQPELRRLTKEGRWAEIAAAVPAEVVEAFAVTGPPDSIGPQVLARCGDVVQRIGLTARGAAAEDPDLWPTVLASFRSP